MALDMSQIERIRDLRALGYSPSEIRRETGYSYPTIRKYLAIDDFSPKRPGARTGRPSLLDGLEGDIEEMLESDRHCYHKQRHTARRVYDRLVAEKGYAGSYSTVQRKVREMRRAMRQPAKDGYVRLHWEPGTMQVDFGQADFDYAFGGSADGDRVRMHFLSMSFPYSNDARCEVFGDEKDVCVCQGLQDAFDMIGGVPRVVVLDNATEAGRRWHDVVTESKLFRRFRLHYGFEARFCNPNSGNEKGNVENKVGFIRRNYMVPAPKVGDLRDYNEALNAALEDRSRREAHYEKGLTWADLFEADKAALLPLPDKDFDVVRWTACRTDGYGRVSLDGGRHVYLASPELANVALTVGVRAFTVEIDGPDGAPHQGLQAPDRRLLHLRRGPARAHRPAGGEGARLRQQQRQRHVLRGLPLPLRLDDQVGAVGPDQGHGQADEVVRRRGRGGRVRGGARHHRGHQGARRRDDRREDGGGRAQDRPVRREGHEDDRVRLAHHREEARPWLG